MYRALGLEMHWFFFAVVDLAVHTEDTQPVVFRVGKEAEAADKTPKDTTLTAFFKLNLNASPEQREILIDRTYLDVVDYFWYDPTLRVWIDREHTCNKRVIASLNPISPKQREAYFLRILLRHVKFPTCFEDMRTVADVVFDTYYDACCARGLLRNDTEFQT
jgi:hypothetical protein